MFGGEDGIGSAARFGNIGQVATDSALNVYVADRNHRVAKGTVVPGPDKIQIEFTAGQDDTPNLFALESSAVVDSGYADSGADIELVSPGLFRAILDPNGNVQFYRVRR